MLAAPKNRFVRVVVELATSIVSICKGGSIKNCPYNVFSRKKIK
jgi:membrane-associated PAP2 superfamily phosphatase